MSVSVNQIVKDKSGGRCWYCGKQTIETKCGGSPDSFCVDHIIPKSMGGDDALDNLAPCCRACNSSKGKKDLEQFRTWLSWREAYGFSVPLKLREQLNSIGVSLPVPEAGYTFFFERDL